MTEEIFISRFFYAIVFGVFFVLTMRKMAKYNPINNTDEGGKISFVLSIIFAIIALGCLIVICSAFSDLAYYPTVAQYKIINMTRLLFSSLGFGVYSYFFTKSATSTLEKVLKICFGVLLYVSYYKAFDLLYDDSSNYSEITWLILFIILVCVVFGMSRSQTNQVHHANRFILKDSSIDNNHENEDKEGTNNEKTNNEKIKMADIHLTKTDYVNSSTQSIVAENDFSVSYYNTLYEELKEKCNPANYMNPYDAEKIEISNQIYSQLDKNSEDISALIAFRNQAIKKLGVSFSGKELFEKLSAMFNPQKFIGDSYDSDKLHVANKIYAKIQGNADNIIELENIAIKCGLFNKVEQEKEEDTEEVGDRKEDDDPTIPFTDVLFIFLACLAIIILIARLYSE